MDKYTFTREVEENYIIKADSETEARGIYNLMTNFKDQSLNDMINQFDIRYEEKITNYKPEKEEDNVWI